MPNKTIRIADDFSPYPSGRYCADGPFSGEKFREEFLLPALKENDKVIVIFDGARGYGSSFLEEAFGGIVRSREFTLDQIKNKLELSCEDKSYQTYVDEAWVNINEA